MHELAKKVLIGIPTNNGCRQATEVWLLVQAQRSFRVIYGLGPLSVEDARTKVVSTFLAQPEFTHLLFVDSDVVPPFNVIENLYKHNLDVVAGNYPLYIKKQIHSAAFKLVDGKFAPYSVRETGLKEVAAIGLGCVLIKKEVMQEAVKYACFQMKYGMKDGKFDMLDSEDITFSKVVQKCGFKIHCDFDQVCDHYKNSSLLGIIEDVERGDLVYDEQVSPEVRL
jgi:hypothetical protein